MPPGEAPGTDGHDQVIFMLRIGHTTHDQIMRTIEIVLEKVIPRFED